MKSISLLRLSALLIIIFGVCSIGIGIIAFVEPALIGFTVSICTGPLYLIYTLGLFVIGVVALIVGAIILFFRTATERGE